MRLPFSAVFAITTLLGLALLEATFAQQSAQTSPRCDNSIAVNIPINFGPGWERAHAIARRVTKFSRTGPLCIWDFLLARTDAHHGTYMWEERGSGAVFKDAHWQELSPDTSIKVDAVRIQGYPYQLIVIQHRKNIGDVPVTRLKVYGFNSSFLGPRQLLDLGGPGSLEVTFPDRTIALRFKNDKVDAFVRLAFDPQAKAIAMMDPDASKVAFFKALKETAQKL